ncbi:hypothetical protein [Leptotrichia trevisanii]|uniref:hypothetical protein n=1 Tax=Leptotrichia trevisanii TaxID=109328 RepID=UPI0026F17E07|nr:hypothetical protein [Leptotrichia trevisanii]
MSTMPKYPVAVSKPQITSLSLTNYFKNSTPVITSKYSDFYDYQYNAYTNPGPLVK